MGCRKEGSLLRSHACFLGLRDDCLGSLGYPMAGATTRAKPRQKQVCCVMSPNLELTNIVEEVERLRSSQPEITPSPVIGENYYDVKVKPPSGEPTETEWSTIFKAGHWEAVSKELQSQDPPNESRDGYAVNPDQPVLAEEFRSLMRLTPSSVVIVFAKYHHHYEPDEDVFGMLVASFTPVSLNPEPYVSFNVKRPSRTYDQMLQTKTFTILAPENAMLAAAFARPVNKKSILSQALGKNSGIPKKKSGVLWWARCELIAEKSIDVGDHTIVVGRVLKVGMARGSPRRGHVIIYSDGQYREIGSCVHPHDDAFYIRSNLRGECIQREGGEPDMQAARKATEEPAIRGLNVSELMDVQAHSENKADQVRQLFEPEASTTPPQRSYEGVAVSGSLQEGMGKAQQQAPAAELDYYRKYLKYLNTQMHNLRVGKVTATGQFPSLQQETNARMIKHQEEDHFRRWLIEKLSTQKAVVKRKIFSIRFPESSLVHRIRLTPLSGDGEKQDEALEKKKRLLGSELSKKLKQSQLLEHEENNKQPLSQDPVSNHKISYPLGYEAIKEASSDSGKMDKKQHGSKFDGLITYHQYQGVEFPSLEQEQAAEVAMDTVHTEQDKDQVGAGGDNSTSVPGVEESEIQRRPAKLSKGMEGLYNSFSGWMQDSNREVADSSDREATKNEGQHATGTGFGRSPSGRDDAPKAEGPGAESNETYTSPEQKVGSPATEYLRRSATP